MLLVQWCSLRPGAPLGKGLQTQHWWSEGDGISWCLAVAWSWAPESCTSHTLTLKYHKILIQPTGGCWSLSVCWFLQPDRCLPWDCHAVELLLEKHKTTVRGNETSKENIRRDGDLKAHHAAPGKVPKLSQCNWTCFSPSPRNGKVEVANNSVWALDAAVCLVNEIGDLSDNTEHFTLPRNLKNAWAWAGDGHWGSDCS